MIFLAQTSVSGTALGNWMLALASALGILWLVLQIIGHFRPTPPNHDRYATKRELQTTNERIDAISDEIREAFRAQEKAGKISRAAIYEELKKNSTDIAALREKTDLTYQSLLRIDTKLDRLRDPK